MHGSGFGTTNGENRLLVTDEPVEVQDSRKTTDHFRGICSVPQIIEEKPEDHNM